MADASVNQEGSMPTPHGPQGHGRWRHPWHHRFSDEEMRVFAECKRESLLYRALPLATVLGAVTYAAVHIGYLAANARFGAAPKVILAAVVGYAVGKMSYRKTCMKKMMALPNSSLGQFLRERKGRCGPWGMGGFPSREGVMIFGAGASPKDMYWGAGSLPGYQPPTSNSKEA